MAGVAFCIAVSCMKDQVYSWRISAQKKADREKRGPPGRRFLACLLRQIKADWLCERRNWRNGDEAEQAALKRRVMATVGTIRGGDPARSRRAGQLVREVIQQRHAKESNASRRTD
jgi:hypothetical protein